MKKLFKILGILLLLFIIILIGGFVYLQVSFPKVSDVKDMKIESTPERLERGKYLAHGPAGCVGCHSQLDFTKFSGPYIAGTEGMGGLDVGGFEQAGFVPASNITQDKETGIGNWTDGELFRAITAGIDREGKPLAPMMPYLGYGQMDEEDIKSIIVYIKTLKPIKNKVPEKSLNFPLNVIVRTIPQDPKFTKRPDSSDRVKTGEYYSGACFICHTPFEKGQPNMEKYMAGGREYPMPDGKIIRSANITPDKETGIGGWTRQQFLDRFNLYKNHDNLNIQQIGYMTVMPWNEFATGYTEEDLGAVYDYIMTVKPVSNKVEKIGTPGLK